MKTNSRTITVLVSITLVVLTIVYVLPVYVVITTSLKTPAEISQRHYLILSNNLQFKNFVQAFNLVGPALINSMIITAAVTALCAFIGGLADTISAERRPHSQRSFSSSWVSQCTCRTR